MREILVYTAQDGSLTLTPNDSFPTPLHLLKPEQIFQLCIGLPHEKAERLGISAVPIRDDGASFMLYLDDVDPLAAMIKSDDGQVYFLHPRSAFATLTNIENIQSGKTTLQARLADELGLNTTPEQAGENMRKYKALILQLQSIASRHARLSFYAKPAGADYRTGEAGFLFGDDIDFEGEDDVADLCEAIRLANGFSIDHTDDGKHCMYFMVDNCLTVKQWDALRGKAP